MTAETLEAIKKCNENWEKENCTFDPDRYRERYIWGIGYMSDSEYEFNDIVRTMPEEDYKELCSVMQNEEMVNRIKTIRNGGIHEH